MDLLVLGGGYGTRLFGKYNSATYSPKGLIDVAGKPCIDRVFGSFSDELIGRVIVETNREGRPFYESWAKSSRFSDRTEIFVDTVSSPESCLGVLKTIELVDDQFHFRDPVLIVSPDNLFVQNQDGLFVDYTGGVRLAVYELDSLEDARKYGVVKIDAKRIVECVEKPKKPFSKTIRTSCEIWNPLTFSLLRRWNRSSNTDMVGDFINFLIQNGLDIEAYKVNGSWIDIGNADDLNRARRMLGEFGYLK